MLQSSEILAQHGILILGGMEKMKQDVNYDTWLLPDDEETKLPSGMPCLLRNPSGEYFLRIGSLPGGRIAEAVSQGTEVATIIEEEKHRAEADKEADMLAKQDPNAAWSEAEIERWREANYRTWLLAVDIFVKPVFSLVPKPGDFHPRRLKTADRAFISEWANKRIEEMYKGGRADVETFHPEPGTGAVADGGVAQDATAAG